MSDEIKQFEKDCREEILIQGNSHDLKQKSIEWLNEAFPMDEPPYYSVSSGYSNDAGTYNES